MDSTGRDRRIGPRWWTLILLSTIALLVFVTLSLFAGTFRSFVPVTLVSERAGLVMETGGKVKMRGVEVGRIQAIHSGTDQVELNLEIDPNQARYIPANVQARIRATTAFGAKYVDLIYPADPSPKRLSAG
ncbi:MAG: phospholipid/cholesterol/gamma-HCH transport system substrate-binding protein, partial [Mycobacterium sp.]|nr:phospholipid/cholesterol/gamma-HCH transport system substrate-binding protein [Mycobacterium sp.]